MSRHCNDRPSGDRTPLWDICWLGRQCWPHNIRRGYTIARANPQAPFDSLSPQNGVRRGSALEARQRREREIQRLFAHAVEQHLNHRGIFGLLHLQQDTRAKKAMLHAIARLERFGGHWRWLRDGGWHVVGGRLAARRHGRRRAREAARRWRWVARNPWRRRQRWARVPAA